MSHEARGLQTSGVLLYNDPNDMRGGVRLRWTQEEDRIVRECVKQAVADGAAVSVGVREAVRRIDRPYTNIQTRWYQWLRHETPPRQRTKTNPRCWTDEEEKVLRKAIISARREGIAEKAVVKDVAEQIGRTPNAVAQHLTIMRANMRYGTDANWRSNSR